MNFSIRNKNFFLDDKKVFLNSGEIHYFRIKRHLWDRHLQAAREAGLMAVSTYIPWAWHEPEEGVFDFEGKTLPERDLKSWLEKCHSYGLYCIVKPGPFILAETRGAGIPYWFREKFGDSINMHDREGNTVPSDGLSLFNGHYLEYVEKWYDKVMPFISKREISVGGPIIMMQVCNEIGVFAWLAHQADYNEEVHRRFTAFLEEKYGEINELNRTWQTTWGNFAEIELPPDGVLPFNSHGDRARDYDWHRFWRKYYADYLKMLASMAREWGVTVPFYHNLPGWIYGHGYEFPVNITMYEELFGDKSEIMFGLDHIPEFLSHRNMHDDRIINDMTDAMQGGRPMFAAEFQCGSREYHVVTNPREMELFYKASIAHGLTGWNYYMFSQGRNPRQRGYSGSTFYWFTPLTPEGERSSAFPLVQRMSKLLKTSQEIILDAERKADICVLFYPPYYATELERPETGASELKFSYAAIRRSAYFDGLLKVLQVLNIDYDMANLAQLSTGDLSKYKQLWAFSTDEMDAPQQQLLVDYASDGGQLLIFPQLPDREMSQKPCTIIRDSISVFPSGAEAIDSPLIDLFDQQDIKCANPQMVYDERNLAGAEIIARTIKGTACGFKKRLGKGSVIHLGTWLGFDTEGHKEAYESLLKQSGARLWQAETDSDYLTVRERFAEDRGLLFIGNYYNEDHRGKIKYTHPATGEMISIPYSGGTLKWPGLYGIISPLNLEIEEGLHILHSTSDLLEIRKNDHLLEITLIGDRDLEGELVLDGENAGLIQSARVEGETVSVDFDGKRVVCRYQHKHQEEVILTLQLGK